MFDKSHWKPDRECPACEGCGGGFGLIHGRRRHHCRQCGGVFCNQCSQQSVLLPSGGGQAAQRSCQPCFDKFQQSLSTLSLKVGNRHQLLPPSPDIPASFGGSNAHCCTTFVTAGEGGEASFDECVLMVEFGFGNQVSRATGPPFEVTALFAREVPMTIKIHFCDDRTRVFTHWLSFGHAEISKQLQVRLIAVSTAAPQSVFSRPLFFRVLVPVTVTAESDPASLIIGQIPAGIVTEVLCSQVTAAGVVRLGLTRGWVSQRAADGAKQLERVRSVSFNAGGGSPGQELEDDEGDGEEDDDDHEDVEEDEEEEEYEISEETEALRSAVIDAVTEMVAARAFKSEVTQVVSAQHQASPVGRGRTLSYSSHRSPQPLSDLLGGDVEPMLLGSPRGSGSSPAAAASQAPSGLAAPTPSATFACKTVANMLETHRQRCEAEHVLSAAKVVALAAHLEQHGRRCATELVHPGVAAAERVAAAAGEAGADESWQTRSFSDTFACRGVAGFDPRGVTHGDSEELLPTPAAVGGTLFGEGDEMGQQWAAAIAEEQGEEAGGGGGALPSRYDPAGAVLGPGGFY